MQTITQVALNLQSPGFNLSSSWNYRNAPQYLEVVQILESQEPNTAATQAPQSCCTCMQFVCKIAVFVFCTVAHWQMTHDYEKTKWPPECLGCDRWVRGSAFLKSFPNYIYKEPINKRTFHHRRENQTLHTFEYISYIFKRCQFY